MHRREVTFTAPRQVELRTHALRALGADEVLVQTELTAISAGTEMLLYRGQVPESSAADADTLSRTLAYPVPYGYCAVGKVAKIGSSVNEAWLGRLVFAFQTHATDFISTVPSLIEVPADLTAEEAIFLPNAETAVNLVQDGAPILGECVLVLGQGVVGLLTAAILHEFPLACLVTVDRFSVRQQASESIGVTAALNSGDVDFQKRALDLSGVDRGRYDVTFELTGSPSALDVAISLTTYSGRVVVGSWYGSKRASLDLGGAFHRSRIRLVASQVSTIAPELSGRWDKARRFSVAWDAIRQIRPSRWITHRFPVERAADAYRLLDESPNAAIQVVFQYS